MGLRVVIQRNENRTLTRKLLGVLIHVMRDRPLFEITKEIDNLRVETRREHLDVRGNARVFATMWAHCKKVANSLDKDGEYVGETRAKKRKNGS